MLLSRQAILLVTAVGVGLLTLCYVLGVQVGKQSAALRRPLAKGAGEELEELPATMAEQLKALEQTGSGAGFEKPRAPEGKAEAPAPEPAAPDRAARETPDKGAKEPPAKDPAKGKAPEPAPAKPEAELWSPQLVSTPDAGEAKAVAAKAKAAGFKTETVAEKGLFKVRLVPGASRTAADAAMQRLKNHGFKPFAVRVDR